MAVIQSQQVPIIWGVGSREGFLAAAVVQLTDITPGIILSYAWTFLDIPTGSASTIATPTLANATFTPDRVGSYLVKLVTDSGLPTEDTDIVRLVVDTERYSLYLPAATEQYNGVADPTNIPHDIVDVGWKENLNYCLLQLDELAANLGLHETVTGDWHFTGSTEIDDLTIGAIVCPHLVFDDVNEVITGSWTFSNNLDVNGILSAIDAVITTLNATNIAVTNLISTNSDIGAAICTSLTGGTIDGANIVHDDINETITGDWTFTGTLDGPNIVHDNEAETIAALWTFTPMPACPATDGYVSWMAVDDAQPEDESAWDKVPYNVTYWAWQCIDETIPLLFNFGKLLPDGCRVEEFKVICDVPNAPPTNIQLDAYRLDISTLVTALIGTTTVAGTGILQEVTLTLGVPAIISMANSLYFLKITVTNPLANVINGSVKYNYNRMDRSYV